jgi:hypothetical protein
VTPRLLVLASVALYLISCGDGLSLEERCASNCDTRGYTYTAPGTTFTSSCTCGPVEEPVAKPCPAPVEAP